MEHSIDFLNMLSQGERSMQEGREWFNSLPADERRNVLRELANFCAQADVQVEDIPQGTRDAGLKATFTPVVMASKAPTAAHLTKMANLPEYELEKAFRLLVALLSIADARRYDKYCADGCTHAWHQVRREED